MTLRYNQQITWYIVQCSSYLDKAAGIPLLGSVLQEVRVISTGSDVCTVCAIQYVCTCSTGILGYFHKGQNWITNECTAVWLQYHELWHIFLRLYMYVLIRYVIRYETVAPYSVKRLCVLTVNFSLETTSPCTYTCMSFHWECMFVLSYCMCSWGC